jgi:drug/metabolite transporter (DMT)-like permease
MNGGMNGLGPLSAFFSSITWAVGSSNYSKMSQGYSPFTLNFTRAAFALPCFLLAALIQFGGIGPAAQAFKDVQHFQLGWFFVSVVASYGFGDAFFLWSSQLLGVPGSLAIASVFPVWTALAAYFFYGEQLNFHQCLGLVIVVGGVATVILSEERAAKDPQSKESSNANAKSNGKGKGASWVMRGFFLAIVGSLFWAVNSYAISRAGHGVSAFVGNAIRMAMALPFAKTLGLLASTSNSARGKPREPMFLPFSIVKKYSWVFVSEAFLGSSFFVYGLCHSPLGIASTLSSLAPVLSVPFALALKVERYSLKRTLGVSFVVFGLCLLMGAG